MAKDYTLEAAPQKTESDKRLEAEGIPVYMDRLELSEAQVERLTKEIFDGFEVLKAERGKEKLEPKWKALDNQYEGKATEDELLQFNLNKNVTKVKIDTISTLEKQAFFESDPIFSVSPRPEFYKEGGEEISTKQQDFLDCKLDNLPFEQEMSLVFHSANVKGTGILKLYHDIQREARKREEKYESKLVPVVNPDTQEPLKDNTGKPVIENQGLKAFLRNWPNAPKDYPGLTKKLAEGGNIAFVASYKETTYNDPRPRAVDLKDFYVRIKTNGFDDLKTTQLIIERENYTYWELIKEEAQDKFFDIDKLVSEKDDPEKKVKDYANLDFDILQCTYYFKLNKDDEEETKIVCWFSEEKKILIGSILYPYYIVPCNYVPFYIKRTKKGFYQPGVAEDLTDNNLAENAILNLTLTSAYLNGTVTPITASAKVHAQFLEKRFAPGVPIEGKPGEVDFLQKYMRPTDINGMLMLLQYLVQGDDDVSRVSSGMSGQESAFDPNAPAAKTIALLKQSGIGISDYIKTLIPSFNEVAYILLGLYYQMSEEGRRYTIKPEHIVGDNPFGVLERDEMVARTNIQARAYSFDFDKINEKATDLALYQIIRQELLIAKNPQAVYVLLKVLIDGWSKKWKNKSSEILPTLAEFKKMQIQTAMQGVAMYVQGVMENTKNTGVQPEFKVEELLPIIADLQAMLVTPPSEEVIKQQEKANA